MRKFVLGVIVVMAVLASYDVGTQYLARHSSDVTTAQSDAALGPVNPLRLMESPLEAQTGGDFRGYQKTFVTQSAVSNTLSSGLMRGIPINHTSELIVTGAPATCTYRLQGTRDGVTWFNLSAADVVCTATTVAFEANKPTLSVRGSLLTLTGGTAPTVTLKYVGR